MTVRIAERVRTAISKQAASTAPAVGCGLLVGYCEAGQPWIVRSLRCVNAAQPAERTTRFEIDPRVVVNVRRSLRETPHAPHAILGFYYTDRVGSVDLGARDLEHFAALARDGSPDPRR